MTSAAPIATGPAFPVNPTAEDIARLAKVIIPIFNPSDVDETFEAYGQPFRAPACSTFTVENRGAWQRVKKADGRVITDLGGKKVIDPGQGVPQGWLAQDIATHIISDACMGGKGFIILFNDGRDEERRLAARERWLEFALRDAEEKERREVSRTSAFIAANPGMMPPRMSRSTRAALTFLEKYKRGDVLVGDEAQRREDLELLSRRNPALAAELGSVPSSATEPVAAPEPEEQKPSAAVLKAQARAERAKTPSGDQEERLRNPAPRNPDPGRFLYAEAKRIGMKLTPGQLRGLLEERPGVITAVTDKIVKFRAKNGAKPAKR